MLSLFCHEFPDTRTWGQSCNLLYNVSLISAILTQYFTQTQVSSVLTPCLREPTLQNTFPQNFLSPSYDAWDQPRPAVRAGFMHVICGPTEPRAQMGPFAVTVLKVYINFKQVVPTFHFALIPANYVTSPESMQIMQP